MNRKKAREVNQETKKFNETIINNPPEPPPEKGEPGDQYTAEDIAGIAEVLMDTYRYAYRQQCEIIGGIAQLDVFLGKAANISPVFIIYNKDGNHWVVFTIIIQKSQEAAVVLYKDSFGQPIPDDVKNLIKRRISHIDFKTHSGIEQVDNISCGPMALKNLDIMLKKLKENQSEFIDGFERIKFCSQLEVRQFELGFKAKILDKLLAVLTQKATGEFKKSLKEFIDICSNYGDISSSAQEYVEKLQKEADKREKDPNYKINTESIEQSRKEFLIRAKSLKQNKIANDKNQKIQLEIQTKFPIQMHIFTKIFRGLAKINLNDEYEKVLRQISQKLEIDFDKLKQFFEIQKTDLQKDNDEQTKKNETRQKNLEELINDIPAFSASKPDKVSIKSFEELLLELKKLNNNETFKELEKDYEKINQFIQTWKNKDISAVHYWAQTKKGNLTHENFWEAIAVMSRGNELVTGGHQLRDTQILSVLAFIRRTKDYGKLCQIHTGEGKTTIVSLFATLKVLQGEKVDVVTSNQILAMEGKKSRENFYNLFDISVDTNNADESYSQGPRECYNSDVVYGSIGNFQFDYLKDSFEGLETRSKRGFSNVILDEVDSMLIDNGGYIAKLALPFPGMDSLKYIYVKIWQELFKAEHNLYKNIQEKLKIKSEELALKKNISDKEKQFEYDRYLSELLENQINELKYSIKASNPVDIDLIPKHLVMYARNMLDKWIDNAIYAKYQCSENEQYVIKEKDKENIIVPVDYQNTGVTLKNTIWSNGLHQFLQLKHNLHLTSETLTSSFISNIGYIKLYNNNIFGLTGTLGSLAEQQLLSKVYNVEYARIPTYKQKKFQEFGGVVIKDSHWTHAIALDSFFLARQGRSILIICKTIRDLREIEKNIEALKKIESFEYLKIKTYPDEDSSDVVDVEIGVSEVIIATNIAGRGTDFKTSMDLEQNGGLHICVSFLPVNQRVEDQAFGRTARQGNFGTAQLIIKESDLTEIGFIHKIQKSGINFNKIKEIRDEIEKNRLKHVQDVDLPEIDFQDTLFNKFSEMYRDFKSKQMKDGSKFYVVKDLKENWAFWLQNKNFKGPELAAMAEKEFELFKNDSRNILNGNIIFNPYYSIAQGEYFLSINKIPEAKLALEHAIQLSQDNTELLYSAYMKLFEVAIESGNQLRKRFYKALKDTFFVSENVLKIDEQYRKNAEEYLIKAKKALAKELNYLKIYYFGGEEKDIEKNVDFRKILISSENNLLVKHIKSRYIILNTFHQHVDSLLEQIGKEKSDGIAIGARIPQYLNKLDANKENEKELKSAITESELSELGLIGLDTIYALRTVHDVPKEIISRAQIQIGSGLSLLLTGLAFPPAMPIVSPIAGTLINEGLCDIVIELITKGFLQFDEAAYIKGKCISYGIAIATMGISAIVKSTKMLDTAIKACKKLASILRKCTVFQSACEKLASILEKIALYLEKVKLIVEFNRLGQVSQLEYLEKLKLAGEVDKLKMLGGIEKLVYLKRLQKMGQLGNSLSRYQIFSTALVKIGKESLQGVVCSIISEKIVTKALEETLASLRPKIRDKVQESIKRQINKNQLKSLKRENINSIVNEIINGTHSEMAMDAVKEIALGVMRHSKSWKVKVATLALESTISFNKISSYTDEFCEKLRQKLANIADDVNNNETIINEIIESIIDQVTNNIYAIIMRLAGRFSNTFVVNPIMNQAWNKLWGDDSKEKIEFTQEDMEKIKSFAEIVAAFETLNIPPNASEKEIQQAYRKALFEHHPSGRGRNDPNASENTRKILEAYKLITNIRNEPHNQQPRGPLYLPPGPPPTGTSNPTNLGKVPENINNELAADATDRINQQTNLPVKFTEAKAHKGNIQTFAQVRKQYIIVRKHQPNGEINLIKIGEEFEAENKPPVILDYFPPDGTHGGHYDTPEDIDIPVQSTGDNSCCYDSIAAQLQKRDLNISSEEIRDIAESPNNLNIYYNQLVFVTELSNNKLVTDNAREVLGQCLVGGDKLFNNRRPRRYIHNNQYPSGQIPIIVHENGKNILADVNNLLNAKIKEAKAFEQKTDTVKLRHIRNSFSYPVFGVSPEEDAIIINNIFKSQFMIGVLEVRFNNGKTIKFISLSGNAKFTTQLVVPEDKRTGSILDYPFEPKDFSYDKDEFKFVSPIKVTDKFIYDVANKKYLPQKYSRGCAAQRMFYELGEYIQEQLKNDDNLTVVDIKLAESWFKETNQDNLKSNQIIIEDSCPYCRDVLPLITGKNNTEKETK